MPPPRVIAVANQKGGVAKTTTVASLGVALHELGCRVLLVDLDPQACLTFSLGLDPESLELSVHDVLLGRVSAGMAVAATADGPDLLPSTIDLAGGEVVLMARTGREHALRLALMEVREQYDVVLIDCPPSLGVLTINGLTAAEEILVPLQCETLSHRGVGQLLDTVHDVQRLTNPLLRVLGVLPTIFDGRTSHARAVLADVQERYGLPVLEPAIAKSVRFAEAPAAGRSVLTTAGRTPGAAGYRILAQGLCPAWVSRRRPAAARGGARTIDLREAPATGAAGRRRPAGTDAASGANSANSAAGAGEQASEPSEAAASSARRARL